MINLVLHESVQGISYLFSLRILEFHLRLYFEVLRLVVLLVCFTLFLHQVTIGILLAKCASVLRNGATTSHRVITVVKFIRMNELELVFVFVVCLNKLVREIALKCFVVS